ncbi:MAG: MG2 domain-containing protein [Gammaproteobacteria bacterium]|nr:MG2 domain-containing protein [Gammaproteobacteria bacterium]MDH5802208.1 MG2 domain-containing protein [Gammaproteobacteria bacterium]
MSFDDPGNESGKEQPGSPAAKPGKTNYLMLIPIVGLLAALFALVSYLGPDTSTQSVTQDPVWSEYVSARSSSQISVKDPIRIRFVHDVVAADKLNTPVKERIRIEPGIVFKARFINPREIEIKPNAALPSGKRFTVTVNTDGLDSIPKQLKEYTFAVSTISQNYEIHIDGLKAQSGKKNHLVVSGRLSTADIVSDSAVEKMLQARFNQQALAITWVHNEDQKHHEFTLEAVERAKEPAEIKLQWEGGPIGVATSGSRNISVPALGVFKVTFAKVVYGSSQKIEVRFSDSLNPRQNVKDHIRLEGPFTTQVQANVLTLYPGNTLMGAVALEVGDAIQNEHGDKLGSVFRTSLNFTSQKPQVKFSGRGVILPENKFLAIPFEAMNVHSVQVTAFRIYEQNIGQFLQSNQLDGNSELERVGRFIWRKTIKLTDAKPESWNRYSLDATDLLKKHPGGLFRLTLSINRGNSLYSCPEEDSNQVVRKEADFTNYEDLNVAESSNWEFAETYFGQNTQNDWRDRHNPCKDAYYQLANNVSATRNFMASNIGIIAKRDKSGVMHLTTTDLRTAKPLSGVNIELYNFQNNKIRSQRSDDNGFAIVKDNKTNSATPFYAKALKGDQVGYLKLSSGSALPVSHFDVGGHKLQQGVKGFIYGERGVWRPGDEVHLTFVLEDKQKLLPEKHPVSLSLINPKGQLVKQLNNASPVGKFYRFSFTTDTQAPTGNWTAQAKLGGRIFTKKLKIETVVPNRLKMELQMPSETLVGNDGAIEGKLFAQWLHGATAAGLKADIEVRFAPTTTRFGRFQDFNFDDPVREFNEGTLSFLEGVLDQEGYLNFNKELKTRSDAPGMLNAYFNTRVFEESGAFSTSSSRFTYHPFNQYVGVKLPKGDPSRGMLLTDVDHAVEIATLDAKGNPVAVKDVEVSLYKIHWRWWWEKGADSLAQYASASQHQRLQQGSISTDKDGKGQWTLNIKYPDWGRYLVRACNKDDSAGTSNRSADRSKAGGKHCTGKIVYIDWPGWAGRAQEQSGPGASVLNLSVEKQQYQVGETAVINLPPATQGRALLSLETGSHILQQRWLQLSKDKNRFEVPVTAAMAPNVYVSVTLIQPHQDKNNDRPIRLYGVVPIQVNDPQTRLEPQLQAADEWAPHAQVDVSVSEAKGRPMTYTLAMVDEGLLGLTAFKTPDLHQHFYKKEALGITTWDLYDQVLNAYGGDLERLLALGGGEDGADKEAKEKRRFPPVVQFFGPFQLKAKESANHAIKLPGYIGAVRLMVVAAHDSSYGLVDKSVYVRQPVMVLPTAPRVIGAEEDFTLPVSVFVSDPEVKQVQVQIKTDDYFSVNGEDKISLSFNKTGDQIGFLRLHAGAKIGKGKISVLAQSGKHKAEAQIHLSVRAPNPPTTQHVHKELKPGESWTHKVVPFGLENTNEISMDVSSLPSMNLDSRLKYLLRYPFGCLEQTTSSVFPQLYLKDIVRLDEQEKHRVDNHIHVAIDKIQRFQHADGSFYYWPGGGRYSSWSNSYAGHFLVEAEKRGYFMPGDMLEKWYANQAQRAAGWTSGDDQSALDQAYRLYTLALANRAELGAMNRLREHSGLNDTSRWYLGAAYMLSGQPQAAEELINRLGLEFSDYSYPNHSFGSAMRDKAVALNTLVLMQRDEAALQLIREISKSLASDHWYSTQSVAYALSSIGRYVGANADASSGANADSKVLSLTQRWGDQEQSLQWNKPVLKHALDNVATAGTELSLSNPNQRPLFVTLNMSGIPKAGSEQAYERSLALQVKYTDANGDALSVEQLKQGTDARIEVRVTNTAGHKLDNLALSHILPAGWEIKNERMSAGEDDAVLLNSAMDYRDIRDDRVYTFFNLENNEEKVFTIVFNAAYAGKYYLPGILVEDMYDAKKQARSKGQWVEVVR